jgi:hypothetical protein
MELVLIFFFPFRILVDMMMTAVVRMSDTNAMGPAFALDYVMFLEIL